MFTVAIIGRPNVGKSTLYNRLTGTRHALVHDLPGVTRDRREGDGKLADLRFKIIDTAGLEEAAEDALETRMFEQTSFAVECADMVLMVIDGRVGVTPLDLHFSDWLRKKQKPATLLINKCEGMTDPALFTEAYKLGFEHYILVSAEHGDGMLELHDAIWPQMEAYQAAYGDLEETGDDSKALQIAIIGRPNAGKSTLTNALIKEQRMLVGPEAGITRDAIAIDWEYKGTQLKLIDTAGIRKKAKVSESLEKLSLGDCFRAVRFAHICVLLTDATQPLEKQDVAIAEMMIKEGRGLVVAVNKWDLIENKQEALDEIHHKVEMLLPDVKGVPVVTLSALNQQHIHKVIEAAIHVYQLWNRRITTAKLNEWLKWAESKHLPPLSHSKRRIRLKYMTQGNTRPPTFTLFINYPEDLPKSYIRYVKNSMREYFGLEAVPIRIMLRKSENPYQNKKGKAKGRAKTGEKLSPIRSQRKSRPRPPGGSKPKP